MSGPEESCWLHSTGVARTFISRIHSARVGHRQIIQASWSRHVRACPTVTAKPALQHQLSTSLPAKNVTQNQATTTSGPGTTAAVWGVGCRLIRQWKVRFWRFRKPGIVTAMSTTGHCMELIRMGGVRRVLGLSLVALLVVLQRAVGILVRSSFPMAGT